MGIAQLFTNYSLPVGFRENFYKNKIFKFQLSMYKKGYYQFLDKLTNFRDIHN